MEENWLNGRQIKTIELGKYLTASTVLDSKETVCKAGDLGSIPGLGRSSGEGNGNPLQHSCLGNPMDRGAWWAIVHGVTKESDTTEQLSGGILFKEEHWQSWKQTKSIELGKYFKVMA